MKICVYSDLHPRSKYVSQSMYDGAIALGINVEITHERHIVPRADVLVAYGWKNEDMFLSYKEAGLHYLYIDLGYWGRKHYLNAYGGYYKVMLNGRHPVFVRDRASDRLDGDSPPVKPWRLSGDNVVVAGHSDKTAISLGMRPMEWELDVIDRIKSIHNGPIVYRPKSGQIYHVPGTVLSHRFESIYTALDNARVLITYHSNTAIEALAYGVPVCVQDGPCISMSGTLDDLSHLYYPPDRERFINNISYCQWRRDEMKIGDVYRQFMRDGLI